MSTKFDTLQAFQQAILNQESAGGNYQDYNEDSGAGGAYQFLPDTWDYYAEQYGRPDLVGVAPQNASPEDQDAIFMHYAGDIYDTFDGNVPYMADAHYAGIGAATEHYNKGELPTAPEGNYPSQSEYASSVTDSVTNILHHASDGVNFSSPMGDFALANFSEFTGHLNDPQLDNDPDENYPRQSTPDSWFGERFAKGLRYTVTTSSAADVMQSLWGGLAHSSHLGDKEPLTQDDLDFVKASLPGDKEAQWAILLNARDSEELRWLVNQKLVDKKREEELDSFNEHQHAILSNPTTWGRMLTWANAGALAGTLVDPINLLPALTAINSIKIIDRTGKYIDSASRVAKWASSEASRTERLMLSASPRGLVPMAENTLEVIPKDVARVKSALATITKEVVPLGSTELEAPGKGLLRVKSIFVDNPEIEARTMKYAGNNFNEEATALSKTLGIPAPSATAAIKETSSTMKDILLAGAENAAIQLTDDRIRNDIAGEHIDWTSSAVTSFLAGAVLKGIGSTLHNANKGNPYGTKVAAKAERVLDDNCRVALNPANLDKIRLETFPSAQKIHDRGFGKTVTDSKYYADLEKSGKVIATSYDDAARLVKKLSGKDLPGNTKAFYVPNEGYSVIIKDNIKPGKLDNVLEHEFAIHGGLKETLGDAKYTELLDNISTAANDPDSIWHQARELSQSYDPEEILAYGVENNLLGKGTFSELRQTINDALKGKGMNTHITNKDIQSIMQTKIADWRASKDDIQYNADGTTAFGGLMFSKDNLLNPQTLDHIMAVDTEKDIPFLFRNLTSAIGNQGYFGTFLKSPSNVMRGLAAQLFDDTRGRGYHAKVMSAENIRNHEVNLYNMHYMNFLKARSDWKDKNMPHSYPGTAYLRYNQLVTEAYNAREHIGNRANAHTDFDPEVMQGVDALQELRDFTLDRMKHSGDYLGKNGHNLVEKGWKPIDEEIWRQSDPDQIVKFINGYVDGYKGMTAHEQALSDLTKYIREGAKRDKIADILRRDIDIENEKIKEANANIGQHSKRKPQDMKDTTVTDKMIDDWLDEHVAAAAKHDLAGSFNEPLAQRIPMDTTRIMQSQYKDGFAFSYDNNLRSYYMDDIFNHYARNVAGKIALKGIFDNKHKMDAIIAKAEKELETEVSEGRLNKANAASYRKKLHEGLKELAGGSPKEDPTGRWGVLARIISNLSYIKNGANMGINQMTELSGSMAYGGAYQLFSLVNPIRKFMNNVRLGKESAKVLEDMRDYGFGEELQSQIWTHGYGDRASREALTDRSSLVNKALIASADATHDLGKITSSLNLLPKMTDAMIKGMQTQTILDSIRWAKGQSVGFIRNPFSTAKMKACNITPDMADKIKTSINKYIKADDKGHPMQGTDLSRWQQENPVTYCRWIDMIGRQAERAIVSSTRMGSKNLMANSSPMMKLLFQFQDYNLRALNGQTLRAMTARDVDDAMATAASVLTNGAGYAGRAGLMYLGYKAMGDSERAEKLKETLLNPLMIARAAIVRSSIVGTPLSFGNNIAEPLLGLDTVRTTVNRKGTYNSNKSIADNLENILKNRSTSDTIAAFVGQTPGIDIVDSVRKGISGILGMTQENPTQRDFRNLLNIIPIPRMIPYTVYMNHLIDASGLPKK